LPIGLLNRGHETIDDTFCRVKFKIKYEIEDLLKITLENVRRPSWRREKRRKRITGLLIINRLIAGCSIYFKTYCERMRVSRWS
jgi:hypothetical protein